MSKNGYIRYKNLYISEVLLSFYCKNEKLHREDGPASISDNVIMYKYYGKTYNKEKNKPSVINNNKLKYISFDDYYREDYGSVYISHDKVF